MRNKCPVEVGDLVECINRGSPYYSHFGLVVEKINYVELECSGNHPDKYSCRVRFNDDERLIRAKWLKVISKNLEKEDNSV